MLHVHRAERADQLVDALADVFVSPLEDPFASEVVAVHSRGIERWISQELSARLGAGPTGDGICANVDFPFPSRLVNTAVALGSGVDPDADPWAPERLVWPLLELVARERGGVPGPLGRYGGPEAAGDDLDLRYSAVRHVADLFDRYAVHRPAMLRRWQRGDPVDGDGGPLGQRHVWQAQVWRQLRERIGESLPERLERACAALREEPGRLPLPGRLALFGLTALPATYLAVIDAVAVHRDVHLLLLHPSDALWQRVQRALDVERPTGPTGPTLPPRRRDPTRDCAAHPLLTSWGRDARELQLVVAATTTGGVQTYRAREHDDAATLLHRLQRDVHTNRAPARPGVVGDPDPRALLDEHDRSVQVHTCHGRLRQVEVMRDALLHLLADDERLEPRDVLVMCPDIETYAPLVTAVFGAQAEPTGGDDAELPGLRVRLADRALRRTNPLLEVVDLLLALPDGRLTASTVLDLATRAPVRRRFLLDDDDLDRLDSWVDGLGVRWGLDAAHRQRHGLPPLGANTWRSGLDRLQLGIAMADEDERIVAGVTPFDDVEGHDTDLAGRLAELVARLADAATALSGPQPLTDWRDALLAATAALTADDPAARWQHLQLHRVLADLVEEASEGGTTSAVPLALGELRRLLDARLRGRPTTSGHRTGDLTVSTLVPMRSVPHRVIGLLGLDDETFPRRTVPDADDLLDLAPRVGDRDTRSEDRQLLLDALLAARDALVITYTGHHERTNEPRPPAVPVDELLDVVDRTVRTSDGQPASARITAHHPLQAFDPRNFLPDGPRQGRPWGFDRAALSAAETVRAAPGPATAFLDGDLPLPPEDTIELADLIAFLRHPAEAFVRRRLDIYLERRVEQRSDAIPVALDPLEQWEVGDQLLRAWQRGQDPQRGLDVIRARDFLPPGGLAEQSLTRICDLVDRITELAQKRGVRPAAPGAQDVDVMLPDGRRLVGTVPELRGGRVEVVQYSRVRGKHRLAAWAQLLALCAEAPDVAWSTVTVGRHPFKKDKRGAKAVAVELRPLPEPGRGPTALSGLARLVDLYDRGRRNPLPLYCETSLKSATGHRDHDDPTHYVAKEWETEEHAPLEREDRDPYHRVVLGGALPFAALLEQVCRDADEKGWLPPTAAHEARFFAYAWRLWEPILDAERWCTR